MKPRSIPNLQNSVFRLLNLYFFFNLPRIDVLLFGSGSINCIGYFHRFCYCCAAHYRIPIRLLYLTNWLQGQPLIQLLEFLWSTFSCWETRLIISCSRPEALTDWTYSITSSDFNSVTKVKFVIRFLARSK